MQGRVHAVEWGITMKEKMDRRFCKTCRFSQPNRVEVWNDMYPSGSGMRIKEYTTVYRCREPSFVTYNMVTGHKYSNPRCETLRGDSDKCGEVGKHWQKQNRWVL